MSPDEFDSLANNLRKLPGEFKALIEKRIELFTLEMGERVATLIAHAMYRVTGILFLALGLILILFAASKLVGEILGNEGMGFVLVSIPILIIGLMFFLRRPYSMFIASRDKILNQFMRDFQEQMSQLGDEDQEAPDKPDDSGSEKKEDRQSHNPQE